MKSIPAAAALMITVSLHALGQMPQSQPGPPAAERQGSPADQGLSGVNQQFLP